MTHQPHSFRLTFGAYAAEILATGATLSRLTYAGRDLILPAGSPHAPGFPGALLAPWPNRTVDGRYTFNGQLLEVPINEAERHHALHGLAYALEFAPTGPPQAATLELTAMLDPTPGYPWQLRFTAHFTLDEAGLRYGVTAENLSQNAAPYGASTHPYLIAGPGSIDDWELELAVSERLEVTPDRLIPQHLTPAAGFTGRLGSTSLDHAFTGIGWHEGTADDTASEAAAATATLRAPGGTGVVMEWDRSCPWVQIFTCDLGASDPAHRSAVALEPMTCAPDAFNDGAYPFDTGLLTLDAGQSHTTLWRLTALEGAGTAR
ncbi:aldose 1-epimerase [Leucobacter exalbidus]|uniref:Aldose 1-epimerase n=1 Tax=Leucobacter exalbidus TaxID=662960 RepID=A0A940T5S9_9MICO|nr:aldose 1-epimerase [Leucobacter exalbidus]